MAQGSGAQSYVAIYDKTAYGTPQGSPALVKIGAATEGVGLKASVEKLTSNALSGARGLSATRGGAIGATGPLPFELPLLGIGKLLKHCIGTVATSGVKLATLGAGLTNIIVKHADSATPAGAGTITLSGSTLTWAAFGETAGAAVNISAGGDFTLQSSVASHALYVMVTGTVTGTSAVATVGAAAYKHVITRGTLPAAFGVEIGHTDIGQYFHFDDCKAGKLSISIPESGNVTGSVDVIARSAARATSALGVPTSVAHSPLVSHELVAMEGGAKITVVNLSFDLDNEIDPVKVAGSRYIASAKEGRGSVMAKTTTLFEDGGQYDKVINETASSLRAFFGVSAGSVEIRFPNGKYYGDASPGIPTAKGIVQSNDFTADTSVGGSDIVVTIINSEATI